MRTNIATAEPPFSFVGRGAELEAIASHFERSRVVTVLGPGGMGKTRLALTFARAQTTAYSAGDGGGAWFVDLSEARDASGALAAVAAALRVDPAGHTTDEALAGAIGRAVSHLGRVLVVLDNFEHVAGTLARFVERWALSVPGARWLVTSRVALGVACEQTLPLDPLSREAATELFLARARAVRPDDDYDTAVIAQIVDAIDRMPLAIELAAARARVLSTADLRDRIARPLELLRGADPDARHGSVRRAVRDSVALLQPAAQRLFALASVLRNGFTLADAEVVLAAHAPAGASVLDGLEALVRTSLLRVQVERGGPARYGFFETVRDAAEELAMREPSREAVLASHAAHYARRAAVAGARFDHDLENLLLAHETCVRLGRALDAVSLAAGAEPLLSARGLSHLRARLFSEALDALGSSKSEAHEARARAHLGRGLARRELGDTGAAREDFEAALARATEGALDGLRAVALTHLGGARDVTGDTAGARALFEKALGLLQRTRDPQRAAREAQVLLLLGHAHRREGALPEALDAVTRAADRYRALGDDEGLASALYELAVVEMFAGRTREALARFDEGLAVSRRSGARVIEGALTTARGCLLQDSGEPAAALEHHAAAARIFNELGSRYREASALHYLATTYVERGEPSEARAVLAQARARLEGVGAPRYEALMAGCAATACALLGLHDEASRELARAKGALALVPDEPSLHAAIAVHGLVVAVRAGEKGPAAALSEASVLVEASPNDDSRFALRALRSLADEARRPRPEHDALVLWPGAGSFLAPGMSERVTLPARSPLRAILERFAARRTEAPGEAVTLDEVIEAGWPGEKMGVEAALNRAHVALATLRRKGLRDVLVRAGGGYAISQSVVVRRREEP